ncbi:MAG: thioredoxin family protein [Simplicispira sp.]|nr:thioredoxin family protein [Simplicispira sp.]
MTHPPAAPASAFSCVPTRSTAWSVVCLCAQWCRVCGEYQSAFEALAQAHPATRFVWVDVEDEEDMLGDLDVETFPTLLIADGQWARFLGPLLPQAPVLARLLTSLQSAGPGAGAVSAEAQAVFERIRAAHAL